MRSDFCLPKVSGATPKTINPSRDTTIIARLKAASRFELVFINTKVKRTPPVEVKARATSCKTATCFDFSFTTFCKLSTPFTSSLRNWSTLDSEVLKIAVLPAMKKAATSSTTMAAIIKTVKLINVSSRSSRNP